MDDWLAALVTVGSFLLLLVVLMVFRARTGPKYPIRNSDIALALITVVLGLVVTRRIGSIEFGGVKVEGAEKAIKQAGNQEVVASVTPLPVEAVKGEDKNFGRIPELV